MKLISFSVTNFRSITKAHKVPFSDTTVLVGRNNEGKSNILKALAIAMNILQQSPKAYLRGRIESRHRLRRKEAMFYYWERDYPIALQSHKRSRKTTFRLEFELNDLEVQEFKSEVNSNLNGTLPVEITVSKQNEPDIKIIKKGRGATTLNRNRRKICDFIAQRIDFNHIQAVRTDKEALEVINNMLSRELSILERDTEYQNALEVIEKLQQPILDDIAARIHEPLCEFLPSVQGVSIEIIKRKRSIALRRELNVVIDDGTPTNIEFKGDGVKSLAALAILKNRKSPASASIIAIEEPESHLHPSAIHQLNEIICSLTDNNQVIVTTHNPLFVDRKDIKSNILINDGGAKPAKSIQEIRNILGIRTSDNLTNANYVLVVEGEEDKIALESLLGNLSERIKRSLKNNLLIIQPIGGAGNLSYQLSILKNSLCQYHVLLDHDNAGRKAFEKAEEGNLLKVANCTFTVCNGMNESEFEDMISTDVYKDAVKNDFGVNIDVRSFRSNRKFSERAKNLFYSTGKPWNDSIKSKLKETIATCVSHEPSLALNPHKRGAIDALVEELESLVGN